MDLFEMKFSENVHTCTNGTLLHFEDPNATTIKVTIKVRKWGFSNKSHCFFFWYVYFYYNT